MLDCWLVVELMFNVVILYVVSTSRWYRQFKYSNVDFFWTCELWSLFILMLTLWIVILYLSTCIVLSNFGIWKLYLRVEAVSKQHRHWNQHQHHWWHGRASASAPGKTVARACLWARAARAISLQRLFQDRSGLGFPWSGPVRSSVHLHPLIRFSVQAGPVRSWTDLHT